MEKSLRPKTDKDFGAPPPGYIAGRGRGATGFASGVSREARIKADVEKEADFGDMNFDKFTGYSEPLFRSAFYNNEDFEADRIYNIVESRMESAKKKSKRRNEEVSSLNVTEGMPDIYTEFSAAKSELVKVTEEQWNQLPVAQERLKAKRPQNEFHTNAPDSILGKKSGPPGMPNSMMQVGEGKKAVLEVSLRGESGGMGVDAQDYLDQLATQQTAVADISEVKKARLLFKSITKTDPGNSSGWIAAARLEEVSGNLQDAKVLVAMGLEHCPTAEDLWIAAVRLEQDRQKAKSILRNAISRIPQSVTLRQLAVGMESKPDVQIRILQEALVHLPSAVPLWKNLVNLTKTKSDALLILARAVECCPDSEDLWLTYANLSSAQEAQRVLNQARKAIPTSIPIWIAAAELADSVGADETVIDNMVMKAIESLSVHGVSKDKRSWLDLAKTHGKSIKVAKSITRVVIRGWILKALETKTPKEVKHEVFADFENFSFTQNNAIGMAVLRTAAFETPLAARKGIWVKLLKIMVESKVDNTDSTFEKAVTSCPESEVLWLMFAKYVWSTMGDVDKARSILQRAMSVIPDSENIYLAAVRIEESVSFEHCRRILAEARIHCPSSCRVWMKSAQVERSCRQIEACLDICQDGLGRVAVKDPAAFKLHIIPVHALLEASRLEEASAFSAKACEFCPNKPAVWFVAADVQMKMKNWEKARAILERGRIRHPKDENLWWKGLLLEMEQHGPNSPAATLSLSRAIQACPGSGLLWSYAIATEPAVTRYSKCTTALQSCPADPLVVNAVAKFFWRGPRQFDKGRKWFESAIKLGPSFGEIWADYLAFEVSQGDNNSEVVEHLLSQIRHKDPTFLNRGIEWNCFRKHVSNWYKDSIQVVVHFSAQRYPEVFSDLQPRTKTLLTGLMGSELSPVKTE
jgi:pre-mRNA-processing factor 6